MAFFLLSTLALLPGQSSQLGPGDHLRTLEFDKEVRTYSVHVPPNYDAKRATPVVLALHGATMSANVMERFTGLNKKSDDAGFIVIYPNGTGPVPFLLTWNSGFAPRVAEGKPDDVRFIGRVLDDVEERLHVDKQRVYATGMSNGGMMCYRLASEMSDRIAAIAAVAGTMPRQKYEPKHKVPVLHIHGTADPLVPYDGPSSKIAGFMDFCSVPETIDVCVAYNRCVSDPEIKEIPSSKDRFRISCKVYSAGDDGAEVILYVVEEGGHTWPGRPYGGGLLGPWTMNLDANDVIWDFFSRHKRSQ